MPDVPHGIKPGGERPKRSRSIPPTIGHLKTQGVAGARVSCGNYKCGHNAVVSFEMCRVADGTPFPALRFKCSKCGTRDTQKMPDWPAAPDRISDKPGRT